jgi:outer membrane protein assembly factor BamA
VKLLYSLLPFLLFPFFGARTQVPSSYELKVESTDFTFSSRIPDAFEDTTAIREFLAEWVAENQSAAYWEASVDSLYPNGATKYTAILHRGPRYTWQQLKLPDDEQLERWAGRAGFRERRFAGGKRLVPEAWTAVRDSILSRAAADGYPFASVGLTDIEWAAPGALSATVDIETGPLIRIGQVEVPEGVRVRNVFLERYLGLVTGEVYSQRRVRRMKERLAQLPYVLMQGSPTISFRDSLAYLDLPLQRRPASRFDFIIGVLPNSAESGKLLITGELNGELYNGFGQGERIAARFEQLRPQTQELQVALDYPFLFGLPFGFEGELELYRRDTSFLNLNWRLAATYLREGNDRLSGFWEQRQTIIPGVDSAKLVGGLLPDTLGVSRSFFGLQLRRTRTDRLFSPRRGYAIDISGAAGFRRLQNITLGGEVGDSLRRRTTQFQVSAAADLYLDPLAGTVIYFGLRAQGLLSERDVLANEQYRIGGAQLLRGFDEQQIFATDYQILTAEFRLLLGERAYLYTFVDAARVNERSVARPERPIDYPLGFGAGVNFDTPAGVFALSLALGRRRAVPLDIEAPKVHLGYVSVF